MVCCNSASTATCIRSSFYQEAVTTYGQILFLDYDLELGSPLTPLLDLLHEKQFLCLGTSLTSDDHKMWQVDGATEILAPLGLSPKMLSGRPIISTSALGLSIWSPEYTGVVIPILNVRFCFCNILRNVVYIE